MNPARCWLGHDWEFVGERWAFCTRPRCCVVMYRWTEEMYFELDVADSRWTHGWMRVQ